VPFWVSLQKFDFTAVNNPKNRQKEGVVYGLPAKLGESIKTHISIKSRDIDTKFELRVETKAYILDFGSNFTYRQIHRGCSRHFEKPKLKQLSQFASESNKIRQVLSNYDCLTTCFTSMEVSVCE
jgi:hypothetical protein